MCRGQQQFQRKGAGGAPGPLPSFGGSAAPVVASEMGRIQAAFEAALGAVAAVPYDILDVRSSGWHHDFEVETRRHALRGFCPFGRFQLFQM